MLKVETLKEGVLRNKCVVGFILHLHLINDQQHLQVKNKDCMDVITYALSPLLVFRCHSY